MPQSNSYDTELGRMRSRQRMRTRILAELWNWQRCKSRAKNQLRPTCFKLHLHVSGASTSSRARGRKPER